MLAWSTVRNTVDAARVFAPSPGSTQASPSGSNNTPGFTPRYLTLLPYSSHDEHPLLRGVHATRSRPSRTTGLGSVSLVVSALWATWRKATIRPDYRSLHRGDSSTRTSKVGSMKRVFSVGLVAAFVLGFSSSSALADYTYSSQVSTMGTYNIGGTTYSFSNQAFVTEVNAGYSEDSAQTRTNVSPTPPNTSFIGAEARLFKENGQLCRTSGMVYDYQVSPGVGRPYMYAKARRLSTCAAGYYYSYGKAARINSNTGGWAYYYTFKTQSLYMYN